MSDGVVLNTGSGGSTVATDDAGAAGHVQLLKLAISADGSATVIPADAANGLDVDVTRVQGTVTTALDATTLAALESVDLNAATLAALESITIGTALPAGNNNIGDVDVATVPADPFGATADAIVAAGAAGSQSAKLRRITQGLEDLKTLIVLGAGTNAIGKLAANSGVDIGDVDVTSVVLPAASSAVNGSGAANVTTSTTTPIASNGTRKGLQVVNDSDTSIYLSLGTAAVLNQGIRLNANGGTWDGLIGQTLWTGDVRAIHGGTGNKVLTWVEV